MSFGLHLVQWELYKNKIGKQTEKHPIVLDLDSKYWLLVLLARTSWVN
jgi:hypothetical protein